jgi:hypothetical protein
MSSPTTDLLCKLSRKPRVQKQRLRRHAPTKYRPTVAISVVTHCLQCVEKSASKQPKPRTDHSQTSRHVLPDACGCDLDTLSDLTSALSYLMLNMLYPCTGATRAVSMPAKTPAPMIPPSPASLKNTLFPPSCGPARITIRSMNR